MECGIDRLIDWGRGLPMMQTFSAVLAFSDTLLDLLRTFVRAGPDRSPAFTSTCRWRRDLHACACKDNGSNYSKAATRNVSRKCQKGTAWSG